MKAVCFALRKKLVNICSLIAIAKQCWCLLSEILGVQVGVSIADIGTFWLSPKKFMTVNIVTSAAIWSIWKLRNELCFQKIDWRSMEVLLYKVLGLLQNWTVLCPGDNRELLVGYLSGIKDAAKRVPWLPDAPKGKL